MKNDIYKINKKRLPITHTSKDNSAKGDKKLPVNNLGVNDHIIFSYKYFICKSLKNSYFNNCFSSQYTYTEWITFYLSRIVNLSTMSLTEIKGAGKTLRFHNVEKDALSKLKNVLKEIGLSVDEVFQQSSPANYYQISFGTGNGRVFGYLINNIYYILLMDPNHLIYKCSEKGGNYDLLHKNYDPWTNLLTGTDLRR